MSNEKENKDMSTRRLNTDEINKKTRSQKSKTKTSDETQVVSKLSKKSTKKSSTKKSTNTEKLQKKSTTKKKKFKERHPRIATIIRIILILIVLFFIIIGGIIAGAAWGGYNFLDLLGDDYKIDMKDLVIKYENSTVYNQDGSETLAILSAKEKRNCVSLSEMSEYLPKAYIAIEDERFDLHSGVDFKRTAAATLTYITHRGKSSFGGSTITQQLVKNLTGDKEDSATRKVKEMVKALQVEHYLSKDQILELYLNLIFVGGEDINGVALGSVYYFNKDVKDLSIAECAYLAGINHSPNAYLPFKEYEQEENKTKMTEKIKKRTKTVLGKMKELGYIKDDQYKSAVEEVDNGLAFSKGNITTNTQVSYAVEAAIDQILDQMMEEKGFATRELAELQLYSGGYSIYVTQDSGIQNTVEEELSKDKYNINSAKGQTEMAIMVIIEPSTGNVLASSARVNRDVKTYLGYFNYPTDTLKQTGSSIKPLAVTAPGLETGKITAATAFYDGPTTFPGGYTPGEWYPGWRHLVSMRDATAYSMNLPHVKALSTIGLSNGVKFLQSIGINDASEDIGLPIALGGFTHGVSVLQMAAGYAMLANSGVYIEPTFYTKVLDGDGNEYLACKSVEERSTRVMNESNAYIVKDMLKSVVSGTPVAGGTAGYCGIPNIDTACKTGTTNNDYDRWLCGFTNYYAAACWFGYNDSEYVRVQNAGTAGGIWAAVMKSIHTGKEASSFAVPGNIVTATICRESGLAATDKCTNTYSEKFVNGTIPSACDVHGITYNQCRSTGLLASEYCEDYETKTIRVAPGSESNGNWATTYVGGEYSAQAPTETCPHTAKDYEEEYTD